MIPLPIRIDHALDVHGLPPHHQDPFDRILISQARIEGVPLISRDPKLTAYGIPVEW
jgi:PIN domain nuclease of toxin-antitoxin system